MTVSSVANQTEARTLVRPSRATSVTMIGDRRSQKHIEGGEPAKAPEAEIFGPARRGGAICEDDHRCRRHVSSVKNWRYAYRLLGSSSLKAGAM